MIRACQPSEGQVWRTRYGVEYRIDTIDHFEGIADCTVLDVPDDALGRVGDSQPLPLEFFEDHDVHLERGAA